MLAFVVLVPAAERELAVDHLFRLGVSAVEERDTNRDGFVELWTEVGDQPASVADAATSLPPGWSWRSVEIGDSVATSWRDHASATWVTANVVVVPTWLADLTDPGGALAIVIDPGAAFGLGDHPTTQLALRALLGEMASRGAERPPTVLDVGCGSGVLAVAAALHGGSPVVAIDISNAAIEATTNNAAANGVSAAISASTTPLGDIAGSFDVVVANVLAPTLIEMADDLRRVVAAGGVLVISGVLADRHDNVVGALAPLVPIRTSIMDGWAAVTLGGIHRQGI